jgi:type IV secretory pathway TraG/TraD family ATPase VirD4
VILIILQSYKQGAAVWGDKGMDKMWSAANVKVYGGGVDDIDFLSDLSKRIGHVDLLRTNVSFGGRQGRSTQRQYESVEITAASDLGDMPIGRIIVIAGGAKPVLAAPRMWDQAGKFEKDRRKLIALAKASEAAHDPGNDTFTDRYLPDPARRA